MSTKPLQPKQLKSVNQAKLRVLVYTLTLAALVGTLFPQYVKAGVLDGLSNTIQQTVNQVTGQITNPIQQVGTVLDDVQDSILEPINNVVGGINRTLGSFLAPFQQQLQQYLQVFTQTFQKIMGDIFGSVFGGGRQPWDEQWGGGTPDAGSTDNAGNGDELPAADAPGVIYGPLQMPDFIKSHEAVDQSVTGSATAGTPSAETRMIDRFNINPVPLAQSMKFQQDRLQNYGMAATVLSTEGQTAMKQEMEAAGMTLQSIQTKAQEAQGFDVTQDVMKNLTAIQANQSSLQAGSYAQLMALRAQEAANSVVTSNISEALDEANRASHAESMATADHALRASAGFYLPGLVK